MILPYLPLQKILNIAPIPPLVLLTLFSVAILYIFYNGKLPSIIFYRLDRKNNSETEKTH